MTMHRAFLSSSWANSISSALSDRRYCSKRSRFWSSCSQDWTTGNSGGGGSGGGGGGGGGGSSPLTTVLQQTPLSTPDVIIAAAIMATAPIKAIQMPSD